MKQTIPLKVFCIKAGRLLLPGAFPNRALAFLLGSYSQTIIVIGIFKLAR